MPGLSQGCAAWTAQPPASLAPRPHLCSPSPGRDHRLLQSAKDNDKTPEGGLWARTKQWKCCQINCTLAPLPAGGCRRAETPRASGWAQAAGVPACGWFQSASRSCAEPERAPGPAPQPPAAAPGAEPPTRQVRSHARRASPSVGCSRGCRWQRARRSPGAGWGW